MSMTVKKLISELEKIENKFLEVEVRIGSKFHSYYEVNAVQKESKKVFIFAKEFNE